MLYGNTDILNILESMSLDKDLAHAYLFVGPESVGKTTFANQFAQRLLCKDDCACGECQHCRIFTAGNHPDFQILDDRDSITVEKTRELIRFLDLKPYQAKRKVVVIANADRMTTSAANSLLKTLEEPSTNTVIILTTTNPEILLPTIKSRVQILKFSALKSVEMESLQNDFVKIDKSAEIIKFSGGKIGLAKKLLAEPELYNVFLKFINDFESAASSPEIFAKIKFAEIMAKDKDGLNDLLSLLEGYYREKLTKGSASDQLKISEFLDKLCKTRELIKKNVNKQLALESLLFTGV